MNEHQKLSVSSFEWATRIKEAWQKTVADFVATGQALKDAKASLPHGDFTSMVEDGLPFSPRVAEHLMSIASNPALSNPKHASDLPASWATLAELARLDAGTIEKFIEEGRIHPELERKQVALLLPSPKAKAKKAAPKVIEAEAIKIVEPAPATKPIQIEAAPVAIIEDEASAEPHYILAAPDDTPPIVHVDPAPSDVMVEHLREELAARDEEIDDLKSEISGFITLVKEERLEIAALQASRAALEDRLRLKWAERLEHAFLWLWEHGRPPNSEKANTIEERVALIELEYAQSASEVEESAPPTQPVESTAQTWDDFVEAYFMADDCPASPNNHPKINAGFVRWADMHGYDIEQLDGAPVDVTYLWLLAGKNCRTQYAPRNTFQESSNAILKRYGSGRRVSVATIATDLKWNRKHVVDILDKMSALDLDDLLVREKEGRETFWTIRRPAKEAAE